MTHIAVLGAGQLGTTLTILLDLWRQAVGQDIRVTLIDLACGPLLGASRGAWIDHATGLEYFNKDDPETGKACIEGSITKRLLLPRPVFDHPIRANRFFVSSKSAESAVSPSEFFKKAEAGRSHYSAPFDGAIATRFGHLLDSPETFITPLTAESYQGVSKVAVGVSSAGGVANTAIEYGYKLAALRRAVENETVLNQYYRSTVTAVEETNAAVTVRFRCDGHEQTITADYVLGCAAHNNRTLALCANGSDAPGRYCINCLLYVKLPSTSDPELLKKVATVNFVIQGEDGAMFACILAPTETDAGVAAFFAPGKGRSYLDECSGKDLPTGWDGVIENRIVPESAREGICEQVFQLNPFLRDYLKETSLHAHAVPGTVFIADPGRVTSARSPNKQPDDRSIRPLSTPYPNSPLGRFFFAAAPKWTSTELAALTAMQTLLKRMKEESGSTLLLDESTPGYGPHGLNVPALAGTLRFPDNLPFPRQDVEKYLSDLGLPNRLIPNDL